MISVFRKSTALFLAIGACLLLSGCIRKQLTVTSEPACADVWINGVYRGKTPVEIPYNWNWYYDIKLQKPGYESYCIRERFYAPAKHKIPFDLIAEILPVRSEEPQWRHYQLKQVPKRYTEPQAETGKIGPDVPAVPVVPGVPPGPPQNQPHFGHSH